MRVDLAAVPDKLKSRPNWVNWRFTPDPKRPDKPRKMPLNPHTGRGAKSNDPSTWTDVHTALAAAEGRADWGLGYMFDGETFGIDIDHCADPATGELSDLAKDVLAAVPSYAEFSPSGAGIHILCLGRPPATGRKDSKLGLEIYGCTRYFTVTGKPVGEARPIIDGTKVVRALFARYFSAPAGTPTATVDANAPTVDADAPAPVAPASLNDEAILRIASRSKDGEAFNALYFRGDISAFNGDHSAADMRLCNMLAFYTGRDQARMDGLFRHSMLMRPKWDERHGESTYGEMTIRKACEDTQTTYTPRASRAASADPGRTETPDPRFAAYESLYAASTDGRFICSGGRVLFVRGEDADGMQSCEPLANFVCAPVEEIIRDDGVESRREFVIEGVNSRGAILPRVTVPAGKFKSLSWITEQWGGMAIINAGQAKADKLREAIQLAGQVNARQGTVYTHTGWRRLGGKMFFLFNGGAVGAEGNISVELDGPLARYSLPTPTTDAQACRAASLALLELAPQRITAPLLATAYLAPLCSMMESAGQPVSHILFLAGRTGSFKSTVAALAMAHFGPSFTASTPTGNFHDTVNAARRKAFIAKDVPLLVDDFHPSSDPRGKSEMSKLAQELARGWGDHMSRDRMNADLTARPSQPPRGLGVMTGEDMPSIDESGIARYCLVSMKPGDINMNLLNAAQRDAREGLLAGAMRGYIEYLAAHYDDIQQELPALFERRRAKADAALPGSHGRMASAAAHLLIGYEFMLHYHVSGGMQREDAHMMFEQGREAIYANLLEQRKTLRDENPVTLFCDALADLRATNALRFLPPPYDMICSEGMGGYDDGKYLYALPMPTYAAVHELFHKQGGGFPITRPTLWRRLQEAGIAEQSVQKRFGTYNGRVIPIAKDALDARREKEGE